MVVPRYDGRPRITPVGGDWKLKPVTLSFPLEGIPLGWEAYTHPEGQLYFYHPEKRIYTDNDVRDPMMSAILGAFEQKLADIVRDEQLVLPADYELILYLEHRVESGGYNWCYYYVDNATRSVFWVREWDVISDLRYEVPGIKTLSDLKYEMESAYWSHWEMYPHKHVLQEEDFTELTGLLTFASIDAVTSLTTTLTYSADEAHRMLGLVKSAKGVHTTDYATVAMARVMNLFLHQRFLNMHGQPHARLGRHRSVYTTEKHSGTLLIKILSPLFWDAPIVHLKGLEKIWIDGVIAHLPWQSFMSKLLNEWQEFVLYATVLLNANVAFLAIPSVDSENDQLSAAQISSNLSIVASVGSILLGLLLIRQHRVKSRDTAEEAVNYLSSRKHEALGLETLAIIYSLPYALLMWGMVTFLLAFSFDCFGTPDKVGLSIFSVVWIAIAILVVWCIYTGWESGERNFMDRLRAWGERLFPWKNKNEEGSDGDGSVHARRISEKARWVVQFLKHGVFPHKDDPPIAEMEERASSTV